MKATIFTLCLIAISYNSLAQEKFQHVEVEGGITVPLGTLKNTMNIAPNIGLWVRKDVSEKNVISFGASVNFPKKSTFKYANDNYTTHTNSFSGMLGTKLDKTILRSKGNDLSIVWSSSFGYSFYFYNDIKAREEYNQLPKWEKDENDKPIFNKPFSSVYIGQGLLFRIKDFGLHARYNYSPYSLFTKRITSDFGSQSVTIGLFYRQ